MPTARRIQRPAAEWKNTSARRESNTMDIAVQEENGVHIIRVTGRLIIGSPSDKLNAALEKLEARGSLKIIVNLGAVEQIDSSGLATLVRHMSLLRRESGALRLVCGEGRVREALTITRLLEAIPTFDNEPAAPRRLLLTPPVLLSIPLISSA